MVIEMNNKTDGFYNYMGKIFGSRIVQRQINDRIYDDNEKNWYLYIEDERVVACVSTLNNVIKNVYTIKETYLEEILKKIRKENKIKESIVPNVYENIYQKVGFKINKEDSMKNFILIYD